MGKKKAYQKECADGFILNKLLRAPKHMRDGFWYSAVDEEALAIGGGVFLPTWDDTDHFHFVCKACKCVADVLGVRFKGKYGEDVDHALFFYLGCPSCGQTGQRKIYLDIRDRACLFQHTYDKGKVYIYGKKREPKYVIDARSDLKSS